MLHDRMTEAVLLEAEAAERLFDAPSAAAAGAVDVLRRGRAALAAPTGSSGWRFATTRSTTWSRRFGALRRNPTDVELMMFAQANSEHCRHKIFNAQLHHRRRGAAQSMFAMIRHTQARAPQHTRRRPTGTTHR